jgi:hypothetical protein
MAEKKAPQVSADIVKYLKEREKADKKIFAAQKANADRDDKFIAGFERLSNRISESEIAFATLKDTAQIVSKYTGAEEAMTREMSHQMSLMFKEDKDLRHAYQKADKATQAEMLKSIQEEALDRLKLDKVQRKEFENAIKKSNENTAEAIDSIIEKSEKMMFPIGAELMRALDGFRHNIVEKFPESISTFFSDAMMEHYKTGMKEIGGHFQTHMKTILAPVEALTGPLFAIGKTMFTIGKTLFSGPTKHEKETAKVQREIRDSIKGLNRETKKSFLAQKKQWAIEKADKLKEGAKGLYKKGSEGFMGMLKKIGPLIMSALSTVGGFISGTLLPALPAIAGFVAMAVSVGKIAMNLINDAGKLGEMLMAGDIAGFARLLTADILDGLLFLPEMIINGILSLFTDFRVDFGKEAILQAIDDMTAWVFDNITVPVMDFFTITIPQAFTELGASLTEWFMKIPDALSGMFTEMVDGLVMLFENFSIANLGTMIWNNIVNMLKVATAGLPFGLGDKIGAALDGVKGTMDTGVEETANVSKSVPPTPSTTDATKAQAAKVKEQVAVQKGVKQELDKTNETLTENNQNQQVIIQNMNTEVKETPSDIPSDNSDLGIMFNNSVFGA